MSLDAECCWQAIDVESCYRYTLGCQAIQGGFAFYACPEWGVEQPNAPDTYAALEILRLLGRGVPEREHCKAWLKAQQDIFGGYPTLVIGYAALKALRLLKSEPLRDPRPFLRRTAEILRLADPPGEKRAGWLAGALRCAELWQAYQMDVTEPMRDGIGTALGRLRGEDGGYGAPGQNLPETAAALDLASALGMPIDYEVLAYARRCEQGPSGFNITPYAVSSGLESQQAGMRILSHFGALPRDPQLIRQYVVSCQSSLGGFGRVPGAISRLEDSLRALQVLLLLAGQRLQG